MNTTNLIKKAGLLMAMFSIGLFIACNPDDTKGGGGGADAPIASFQYEVDATNFLQVTFTNFSQNADTYAWDFGDGNTSTDENPVHTYAATGNYTVKLTATGDGGENSKSEAISISDPDAQLTILAGLDSKEWILQRQEVALGIGPAPLDVQWWGFGSVTPLYDRPCILDDTYTFHRDGTFVNDTDGTFFLDSESNGGWNNAILGGEGCADESTAGVFTTSTGGDYSALANGGSYSYTFDAGANTLQLSGQGAYIGLPNKTNTGDLGPSGTVASTLDYDIVRLAEGPVADTLKLTLQVNNEAVYWSFWLVSYHNAADKPAIPQPPSTVSATFSVDMNNYGSAFTNVYLSGSFNGWSGDANPMTESSTAGVYEITLDIASNTDHEYKFQVDGWAGEDSFNDTYSCAVSSDGGNNWNRGVTTTTADISIPTVCFQECDVCGGTVAPSSLGHTFADAAGADHLTKLDNGASTITLGVADPAGGGGMVGQFNRIATDWQEAIISADPQANFLLSNVNTMTIEVYLPSSNDYTGALTQGMVIGFGDQTEGGDWWTYQAQWSAADLALDTWHTLTFDLTTPTEGNTADATQRTDLDMLFIGFGGGGHSVTGTFYIRNLEIKQVN